MNRFKGVSEIGKGEHGTVYQACLNDACKRKFALKVSKDNLTAEHNLTKNSLIWLVKIQLRTCTHSNDVKMMIGYIPNC